MRFLKGQNKKSFFSFNLRHTYICVLCGAAIRPYNAAMHHSRPIEDPGYIRIIIFCVLNVMPIVINIPHERCVKLYKRTYPKCKIRKLVIKKNRLC